MNERPTTRARRAALRRFLAPIAVVGLAVAGSIALFATTAVADSPNPASAHGDAVLNGDGSVTVTVGASWVWGTKDCPATEGDKIPGWAVAWGDNQANIVVDPIYVGTASDNAVHFDAAFDGEDPAYCTENANDTISGAFHGTLTHTYSAAFLAQNPGGVIPCVVTYDVHRNDIGGDGNHSDVAGGPDRNSDNSVEENEESPLAGCLAVELNPDVKIVKTGPSTGTVGTAFNYTLTVTNTGLIEAPNTTITDVLPAGLTFNSASAGCAYNAGTRTVTCDAGTLTVGQSKAFTVNVTPTVAGTVSNTATVTPNDETPADNTSTWTIGNIQAAAAIAVQPTFTG